MLRKVIVVLCLVSFAPLSAGAQELAAALLPAEVSAHGAESRSDTPKIVVAANDRADAATADATPQKETKSRPSCTIRDFLDIHFGGYRWLWWVGAAGILIGIHVAH